VTARVQAAPRHRHTPRVRRCARELGVDPERVRGTGARGRVTEEDVRRAAVPARVGNGALAAARLPVPAWAGDDRDRLLAVVATLAVAAVRRAGHPVTSVGLTRGRRLSVVDGAHDLTVEGWQRRVAAGTDGACELRVLDAAEVDAQVGVPGPEERAVVAVGAVRERVEIDRSGGTLAFVARPSTVVTVSTAADLPEAVGADVLARLRAGLAEA
jgi:pyruvate/2-oxoglutarate dehydrogenase complex dihydrolipoamide acyltransferase (E2) component